MRKQLRQLFFINSFCCLLLLCISPTLEAAESDQSLSLGFGLAGSSYHDDYLKSDYAGVSLDVDYKRSFNEYFSVHANAEAEFYAGSAVGLIPSDVLANRGPRQDLWLHEAVLHSQFLDNNVYLNLGVINQTTFENPLLGGDYGFMGATENLRTPTFLGTFGLSFEEAVPPSTAYLLQTAEKENTPTFYLAQLSYELGKAGSNRIKVFGAYFKFQDLGSSLARQSRYFGNTVTGSDVAAIFLLHYSGFEGGLIGDLFLSPQWKTTISANAIQNTEAPSGSNTGYLGTLSLAYLRNDYSYAPEIFYFYDQSDSSPALFADSFLGGKDRRGLGAGFKFLDSKDKLSVYARWSHSEALVQKLYVSSQQQIQLGFEIKYDIL